MYDRGRIAARNDRASGDRRSNSHRRSSESLDGVHGQLLRPLMQKNRAVLGEYLVIEVQNVRRVVLLIVHQRKRVHGAAFLVVGLDEQTDQILLADLTSESL